MANGDQRKIGDVLPSHRDLYYGGGWHMPASGTYEDTGNPGTGETLGTVGAAGSADVDAAVTAARKGFREWRDVLPLERARVLKEIAALLRKHGDELALIDAANCGNPYGEMRGDAVIAAAQMDFFAGLVTEMKGDTIPMGPDRLNITVREPLGVVARILAFNHPFMFCGGKMAAPLAAGNAVIIKPPVQAPLSALRLAELVDGLLPSGVFSVLPGGTEAGAALASHPGVAKVTLIGSVGAGRAVMRAASDTLKPVLLELGGKNALIAYPDSDPEKIANAVVTGMNFGWCGQSCGSTSRAFLHEDIHDAVLSRVAELCADFAPGDPTDPATNMGALASKAAQEKTLRYIATARREGARLVCGGRVPDVPGLRSGFFVEPTVFADVTPDMTIAREEIFGPVMCVLDFDDEEEAIARANASEFGLAAGVYTRDIQRGHRVVAKLQAGTCWINAYNLTPVEMPFGGFKRSGIGRENGRAALEHYSQVKSVYVEMGTSEAPY